MQSANYTSENICRALGLAGFANDWQLAGAERSIRLLLMPSFHREVCISFMQSGQQHSLSVVAACSQVWLQQWPTPHPTEFEEARGSLGEGVFDELSSLLVSAASPSGSQRFVVLDGMRVHSVLRTAGRGEVNINENASSEAQYKKFVATAIACAWQCVASPSVRNALRSAGEYVGVELPEEHVPEAKPLVRTLVIGTEEEASQVLEALKKHHGS